MTARLAKKIARNPYRWGRYTEQKVKTALRLYIRNRSPRPLPEVALHGLVQAFRT